VSAPRRIEMLVIGDELLDGRVTNTNSARFGRELAALGLKLAQVTTVTDDIGAIVREARAVVARGTELCVVSGGLGPTADDLTAAAFAELAQVPLTRDQAQVERIAAWLKGRGRRVGDNQLKQADRPQGAEVVPNDWGTAPGFALAVGGCRFVSAPGVPREFDMMVETSVLALLRRSGGGGGRRLFLCYGLLEAEVDQRLQVLAQRFPAVRVAFQVKFPAIHVLLSADAAATAELAAAAAFAAQALGDHVFATRDQSLAATLLERLREGKATLAAAESCTGGLVSDLVTDVPGSSDVFLMGVVVYANAAKQSLLGVRAETLAAHGAVSEPVVLEMAQGVRERSNATYAVAASGIAGPSGGTPEKPVGTIWVAAVGPDWQATRKLASPFDRRGNKLLAAYTVLDLVRRHLMVNRGEPAKEG
jgi:nicotinamide-nucleotide amidase